MKVRVSIPRKDVDGCWALRVSIRITTGCGVMWKLSKVSKTESSVSLTFEAPVWLYKQGRNNPAVIFIAVGSLEQWVNKDARPKLVSVKGD